jgi:hypothetical protein
MQAEVVCFPNGRGAVKLVWTLGQEEGSDAYHTAGCMLGVACLDTWLHWILALQRQIRREGWWY